MILRLDVYSCSPKIQKIENFFNSDSILADNNPNELRKYEKIYENIEYKVVFIFSQVYNLTKQ